MWQAFGVRGMRVLSTGQKTPISMLGFVPNRSRLVATSGQTLFVWDFTSQRPPLAFAQVPAFQRLLFSLDGRRLIALRSGKRVGVNLKTGEMIPSKLATDSAIVSFDQTPDGQRLVTAHIDPWRLIGWRRRYGDWVEDWTVASDENWAEAWPIVLAPTGDRLAHLTYSTRVSKGRMIRMIRLAIRSAATGVELGRGVHPDSPQSQLLFRPDGAEVMAVHKGSIFFWSVADPGISKNIKNDSRKQFSSAAYHPSSRYLFTTSDDSVLMWDTVSRKPITTFTWNIGRLRSIAISPDGTLAAAGNDKGQVVVWDVDG
jgi:WD40 repeat protein